MNQRNRLYIMAFAAYTIALLVMAVLAWLVIQHSRGAGIAQLAVALSGNGIGGFALVLGILRDDRAEKAEQRTAQAQQETAEAKQETAKAQQDAAKAQQDAAKAQQEAEQLRRLAAEARQRAEQAEAELERLRARQNDEFAARIRRLEIAAGLAPPDPGEESTEN